jgi:hypothetical protein
MLLFRSEEHVDRWCREWSQPRGALLTLDQAWALARAWFSDRLNPTWRRKSPEEAEALFAQVGLSGSFWRMT